MRILNIFSLASAHTLYFMVCAEEQEKEPTLLVSDTTAYRYAPKSYKNHLIHVPFILRLFTFVMVIIILARPQTSNSWKNTQVEGIDIMLAVDVSTSMLAEDLKPNRLEAAKQVASEFIAGRPNDNIGLTILRPRHLPNVR